MKKRILALVMLICLTFVVVACDENKEKAPSSDPTDSITSTTQEQEGTATETQEDSDSDETQKGGIQNAGADTDTDWGPMIPLG